MYTNIQQDQKAKLYYHMSMLFAYMAGGERVGVRGLKRFCQRGSEYFLLPSCVCVGGGGQVRTHGIGCVRQWFRTAEPLGNVVTRMGIHTGSGSVPLLP